MNVAVIYAGHNPDDAKRFGDTYRQFPSGYAHDLVVMDDSDYIMHHVPPQARFIHHDCRGLDNGKHQWAAKHIEADMMVFMGGHAHFHRSGWLKRMVEVFEQLGRGNLYGSLATSWITPHIRTTGYWHDPLLFEKLYPEPITTTVSGCGGNKDGGDRYAFEHGEKSLTRRFLADGRHAWLVTWNKVFPPEQWIDMRELQWVPEEQGNLLLRDRYVDLYRDYNRCPAIDGIKRCQLVVEHSGQHWAEKFFE